MTGALVLTLGLAVTGMFLLHGYLPALDWMQSWLLAITGITFLAYGYDKLIAGTGATRVPEKALLTLAFAGGTVGAIAGMRLFHHKTSKKASWNGSGWPSPFRSWPSPAGTSSCARTEDSFTETDCNREQRLHHRA